MRLKLKQKLSLMLFLLATVPAGAVDIEWRNVFTFYGDNTEFFEPYRTGETILGQQGKSYLQAALGPKALLSAGVFGDFRSQSDVDPAVDVKPVLSFEFHEGGTRMIMGTLDTTNRHGFIEPLEVTFLEFTRPIEYGLQWIENDPGFKTNMFLDWHQLNTPSQPEQMDYGGVWQEPTSDLFSFEQQLHGFHDGGQLYATGGIVNNWVLALGFRWTVPGLLGTTRFDAFGLGSGLLYGDVPGGTQYGGGAYLKTTVLPDPYLELFGIGSATRDFYTAEGDANYASYSSFDSTTVDQIHPFVTDNRTYFELGAKRTFPMEGALFEAEFRVHFVDQWTAYSYRLAVVAPLDFDFLSVSSQKGQNNAGKPVNE